MQTFYFTYGTADQPFVGGWTEIVAPDFHVACQLFKAVHPCRIGNILNCASAYSEKDFKSTTMFAKGNFGARCHEKITIDRAVDNTTKKEFLA